MVSSDEFPHEHDWVLDRLAVGNGVNTRAEVARLAREGITHVIDCRSDPAPRSLYAKSGVLVMSASTDDDGQRKGSNWFAAPVFYAMVVLRRPSTKILVHCHAGINRGPSMAYAIMRAAGYDRTQALSMIRMARPIARIAYSQDADRFVERWRQSSGYTAR